MTSNKKNKKEEPSCDRSELALLSLLKRSSYKIFNFKIVATVSFVMYQLSNKVPPERILKNVKHFRKNYDKYVENPELIQRELKTMEYMDIGLSKIEESEKIDLNKEKSRDDYDLEL